MATMIGMIVVVLSLNLLSQAQEQNYAPASRYLASTTVPLLQQDDKTDSGEHVQRRAHDSSSGDGLLVAPQLVPHNPQAYDDGHPHSPFHSFHPLFANPRALSLLAQHPGAAGYESPMGFGPMGAAHPGAGFMPMGEMAGMSPLASMMAPYGAAAAAGPFGSPMSMGPMQMMHMNPMGLGSMQMNPMALGSMQMNPMGMGPMQMNPMSLGPMGGFPYSPAQAGAYSHHVPTILPYNSRQQGDALRYDLSSLKASLDKDARSPFSSAYNTQLSSAPSSMSPSSIAYSSIVPTTFSNSEYALASNGYRQYLSGQQHHQQHGMLSTPALYTRLQQYLPYLAGASSSSLHGHKYNTLAAAATGADSPARVADYAGKHQDYLKSSASSSHATQTTSNADAGSANTDQSSAAKNDKNEELGFFRRSGEQAFN